MNSSILLTVDCLRRDHVGYYGYDRPTTPNIDSVADSAAAFEGYANCPGTRWAFQVMHTGVLSSRIDGLGIPEDYTPLAKHFQTEDYSTAGFANNGWVSRDYNYDCGFDTFYGVADTNQAEPLTERIGKAVSDVVGETMTKKVLEPVQNRWLKSRANGSFTPSHTDADTVDAALSWLSERNRPYFLWVHFLDAHTPYGRWPKHLKAVRGDTAIEHTVHPGKEGLITEGSEPPQRVIDTYDAGIRSADEQIGRILEVVDDSTTIVITGDHGEEFGKYNQFHSESFYHTMTDVPLVVRDENIDANRDGEVAQHIDIPPTLLSAGNIGVPDHWDGVALQDENRESDPIYFALGGGRRGIQRDDWKHIELDGEAKLLKRVNGEEIEHPSDQGPSEELREHLAEFVSDETVGQGYGNSEVSEVTRKNLENLGYL